MKFKKVLYSFITVFCAFVVGMSFGSTKNNVLNAASDEQNNAVYNPDVDKNKIRLWFSYNIRDGKNVNGFGADMNELKLAAFKIGVSSYDDLSNNDYLFSTVDQNYAYIVGYGGNIKSTENWTISSQSFRLKQGNDKKYYAKAIYLKKGSVFKVRKGETWSNGFKFPENYFKVVGNDQNLEVLQDGFYDLYVGDGNYGIDGQMVTINLTTDIFSLNLSDNTQYDKKQHIFSDVLNKATKICYYELDSRKFDGSWKFDITAYQNGNKALKKTNDYDISLNLCNQINHIDNNSDWNAATDNTKKKSSIAEKTYDKIDPTVAAIALEGLYQCSLSKYNGILAFPAYNETFIGSEGIKIDGLQKLDNINIDDFAYPTDSKTTVQDVYDNNLRNFQQLASAKYNDMKIRYDETQKSNSIVNVVSSNKKNIIIGGASIGGIAILGCFGLFLKKRKFN